MIHFDEDILLKYILEVLEKDKTAAIQNHLDECKICTNKLNEVKKQVGIISSFDLENVDLKIPLPRLDKYSYVWLKRAAILIIGFVTGYLASDLSRPAHVNVVEQQLTTHRPTHSTEEFIPCETVDVYINYEL